MKDAMYIPLNERKGSRLEDELKDSTGSKSSRNDTKLLSDQMSASIESKSKKRAHKVSHEKTQMVSRFHKGVPSRFTPKTNDLTM